MNTVSIPYDSIGIEPRDMHVYENLYRLPDASIRQLALETGMSRGTVYESLKRLMVIGLVQSRHVGERRRFRAAEPEVISAVISEKQDELSRLDARVAVYAESLRAQRTGNKRAAFFATSYEGDEGVATVLRDVLQTVAQLDRKEYRVIASQKVSSFIYHNFPSFSRQRTKQKIFVRVISDAPAGDTVVSAERRQIPGSHGTLNGYTMIYGSKLALISISDTNVLSAVVLEDKGIVGMQSTIFDQLWSTLTKG